MAIQSGLCRHRRAKSQCVRKLATAGLPAMYAARMNKALPHCLLAATVGLTLAVAAIAGPHQQMVRPLGPALHQDPLPAASASATPAPAVPAASVAAVAPDAGLAPIAAQDAGAVDASVVDAGAGDETPEQLGRRRAYVDATTAKIRRLVHAGGKSVTDEEREVIRRHWRHTMRLWRIRSLAEADGDKSVVSRVEVLMTRSDRRLDQRLTELAAKAPLENGQKGHK